MPRTEKINFKHGVAKKRKFLIPALDSIGAATKLGFFFPIVERYSHPSKLIPFESYTSVKRVEGEKNSSFPPPSIHGDIISTISSQYCDRRQYFVESNVLS